MAVVEAAAAAVTVVAVTGLAGGVAYASVAWSVAVVAISYFLVGVSYFLVGVFVADGGDMDKDMLSSQCWGANGEIG